VTAHGEPSKVDGKKDHLCESCGLDMGPLRSGFVTGLLLVVAGLLTVGSVAVFIGAVALLFAGKGDSDGVWMAFGFALTVFGVAVASLIACYRDMNRPKPLKSPPKISTRPAARAGAAPRSEPPLAAKKHSEECYLCGKRLEPEEVSKKVCLDCRTS
jgi:hypothetical protein